MVTICLMIRQEKDKITKKDKIGKIVTRAEPEKNVSNVAAIRTQVSFNFNTKL